MMAGTVVKELKVLRSIGNTHMEVRCSADIFFAEEKFIDQASENIKKNLVRLPALDMVPSNMYIR